jgi:carbon storage regulator
MLVLSRKESERILIGDNIWVTIVEIRGDKVRLGIEAPANVVVDREEISLLRSSNELKTVADLEVCGLPLRLINALEELGYIYIPDLERLTEAAILACSNLGPKAVEQIREALQNYRDRRIVKTVGQCIARPGNA